MQEGLIGKNINNNKEIKIISVGSLIPVKGIYFSIQAISKVNEFIKGKIKYIIFGDGPEKKKLKTLARKLNISEIVDFKGNVPRENVLEEMNVSDIFLFPSFEGGAMVVLEALALGLPVVSLDFGIYKDIVTEECGIKIKPITPEQTINDLADALLKLANDPELRKKMGEAGRRRVMEHYTWEKKGEFIKKVYEEVLNRKL